MRRTIAGLWQQYWAERAAGGDRPDNAAHAQDAFTAGALSALLRAKQIGRDEAWREASRLARAEHIGDMAADVGLDKLDIHARQS